MKWLLLSLILLVGLLSISACGGGGNATLDPDRLILWSSAELHSGETLDVEAILPAGASAPIWNFGGGAEPNTSSEMKPQVRLLEAGFYEGTLSWLEADGNRRSLPFVMSILPGLRPIIQQLHAVTPTWGSVGDSVQLSPVIDGGATSFEWTFSGGVSPLNSTEPQPTLTCLDRGEYLATLVVRNAAGQASAPVATTFWITDAGSRWTFQTPFRTINSVRVAIAGDRLGFFYSQHVDSFSQDWVFVQALVGEPQSATDWRQTVVARQQYKDDRNNTGPAAVGVVGGRPVIVFANATQNQWGLVAVSSTSAQPASTTEWTTAIFPAIHPRFIRCAVAEVDGRIVLFGTFLDSAQWAFVAQANSPFPESSANFEQAVIDFPNGRFIDALVNIEGKLVLLDGGLIGWPQGDLTALPSGWDWSQYSLVAYGSGIDAQVAGPTLYVAHRQLNESDEAMSVLVRGTSVGGVLPPEWSTTIIDTVAQVEPYGGALLVDAGRLYYATNFQADLSESGTELMAYECGSLEPEGPADWIRVRLGGAPQDPWSTPTFGSTSAAVVLVYSRDGYQGVTVASLDRSQ